MLAVLENFLLFVTFRDSYKYLKYRDGKHQDTIKIQKGVHKMYQLVMKKALSDESRSKINDVITQFFEEFNHYSSIDLKNGECRIVVKFEDPPKELIKKMLECNPDEFCYGTPNITSNDGKNQSDSANTDESKEEKDTESEDSDESEGETETDSEDSDESEDETETDSEDSDELANETETDFEDSDESEEETVPQEEDEAPITPTDKTKKVGAQINECGIKLLLDFAAEAKSYEEFVNLIIKTIKFGKREKFFIKLVNSFAANSDESLSKTSKNLGISKNDYNSMTMQVSNYFKRNGEKISFGVFINEVVKYKDYSFNKVNEDSKIETSDEPTVDQLSTEQETSDFAKQTEVKDVVPVIPEFEEFLGTIDKTLPIEKRVELVLSYMDPKMKDKFWLLRIIRSYMTAGISLKVITNEAIMKKDRFIPPDARMKTSVLVTDFIRAKSEGSELVTVADFLEYLKKFILTDDELKNL